MRWLGWIFVWVLALGASGQTVARKGWAGSGLSVEPWWASAVFYQVDPVNFQDSNGDGFGDLKGIAERLPYLQALGVDAIVLSPFAVVQPGKGLPFDPTYGTEDDFAALEGEAGRRKIRILVDLPVRGDVSGAARFWLSRGVAGFRLVREGLPVTTVEKAEKVRELRKICSGFGGQRVVIWDAGEIGAEVAVARASAVRASVARAHVSEARPFGKLRAGYGAPGSGADLTVDRRVESSGIRDGVFGPASGVLVASDSDKAARSWGRLGDGVHDLAQAKEVATVLLAGRGAPLLYFGQEVGMAAGAGEPVPMQWGSVDGFTKGTPWVDAGRNAATANVQLEDPDKGSLLNWYRRLAELHHGVAALRSGSFELLRTGNPDLVAWVRKPKSVGEAVVPVLVVMNLSDRATVLSVADFEGELRRVGVSGGVFKCLARTGAGEVPGMVRAVELEGYGVFVGEVRRGAGLEGVVLPVRRRR